MKNIEVKNPPEALIELFSFKEWRQRIHLFDNLFTPGTRCEYEWEMCHLPNDLTGKSFIDVGANDGMYSFLAEKKGASVVTAIDLYTDKRNTELNMLTGWNVDRVKGVAMLKKSGIEIKSRSIYELDSLGRNYDVVYCGNVLAWLDKPVAGLRQVAQIATKQLIIREDISKVQGKPVLEYTNNRDQTACMFNGNEQFYREYLGMLGFKKIRIIPVDEYKIMEMRNNEFQKYNIVKGASVYINPFCDDLYEYQSGSVTATAASKINNRLFFNGIGWINEKDVKEVHFKMAPDNLLRKIIFERRYRKNALNNCMIFAEK
jgi:tRNA (mo5U34)-methyltransferase